MVADNCFTRMMITVLLWGLLAGDALALESTTKFSQGNKVQWELHGGYSPPVKFGAGNGQFPRGTGNSFAFNGFQVSGACVIDLDGDGVPEDTVVSRKGREDWPGIGNLENAELFASLYAQGLNLPSELINIRYYRVYSSLDEDDIVDWPVGGRVNRNPDGDIITRGAETMYANVTDVWHQSRFQLGLNKEYSFYFLNYGKSNDIVYAHVALQNNSEFYKYNPNPAFSEIGNAHPDGFTQEGLFIWLTMGGYQFGGNFGDIWGWHPADEIGAMFFTAPTMANIVPPEPPFFAWKALHPPMHNGVQTSLQQVYYPIYSCFGLSTTTNWPRRPWGRQYRGMKGLEDWTGDQINPWTGRYSNVFPGMIEPSDQRYDQWIWARAQYGNANTVWGEIEKFAPRDTTSIDLAFMFVPAVVTPLVVPPYDLGEIDNPIMQEAMAPINEYAREAQIVYDGGYVLPESPVAPPLTIIPGDRQVTITWSDVNLNTPDSYYYFLQDNDLDPQGFYREYDFEGYRLFRSYVGPNDSHSEILGDFNLTNNNLQFHYIDELDTDRTFNRMRNGMKIWYSLVPYDKNYDPVSGVEFSLPAQASGKTWNKTGERLYSVIPRSDANEFRSAEMYNEVVFKPFAGEPEFISDQSVILKGNGDGTLADPPRYIAPTANFEFVPVVQESIKTEKTVTVNVGVDNWKPAIHVPYSRTEYNTYSFWLAEGSRKGAKAKHFVRHYEAWSTYSQYAQGNMILYPSRNQDARNQDGSDYAISTEFKYLSVGNFRSNVLASVDPGGYAGADIWQDSYDKKDRWATGTAPSIIGQARSGRFSVTWKEGLTVEVKDETRGYVLPFVEYPDQDYGWGFVTLEAFGSQWTRGKNGTLFDEMQDDIPFPERTAKHLSTLPADNIEEFGIWLNGSLWVFHGTDGVIGGMPPAGTVMTIDLVWGEWNSDKTEFTQYPEPPFPGDSWELKIKPYSMDPENINISKVKVVPNPYIASSNLDLSPNNRRIEFINLPARSTIRIYTLSGNLVNVLNHIGSNRQGWGNYTDWDRLSDSKPEQYTGYDNYGGTEAWNLRNRFGQTVATGLYLYYVEDNAGNKYTGKFYVVN